MNNPFYEMTQPEYQIKVIDRWIEDDGEEESDTSYFFRQVTNNLNLLRFYKHKFGKISLEEYAKWLEEKE